MRRGLAVGAVAGFALGIGVALGMDRLLGSGAGTSWSSAVARDLSKWVGHPQDPTSAGVWAGVVLVVIAIGLVGAAMGGLAGALVGRFLLFLGKRA
jgi:hypothetical protein